MNQRLETNDLETIVIREEISRCEDAAELKEKIFPLLRSQQEQWARKISAIIAEKKVTKSKFAEVSGVSRVTVNKWCNGSIPKNRETFLRIGMAAGYGLEKMNQLLQRYGQYPALYSKSLEDCICIFVLEQGYGENTLEKYNYILKKIKENLIRDDSEDTADLATESFDEKLSNVKNEDELEHFISENSAIFATTYHNFYAYVNMHIKVNYEKYNGSVFELASAQNWSSSLKQCVSAIRQRKWYPTRNKIISLGLHLSMDHDQIDEALTLAHMEPLCAKNIFESVIMFILDDASLNDMLDTGSATFDQDDLCIYAKQVLEQIDLPEAAFFISELELTGMDDE